MPNPLAPADQYGPMLSGRMPPTAKTRVCRRQYRAPGLERRRRQLVGGKHLQAVGAGLERGEGLRRRRDAGNARQPPPLRFADHGDVGVGHHDEASARRFDFLHSFDRRDRSRADETALAEFRRQRRDRFERPRRIERHFENAETVRDQRRADGGNLVGRDAAQHRDQRQRIEMGCEGIGHRSRSPACCAIR